MKIFKSQLLSLYGPNDTLINTLIFRNIQDYHIKYIKIESQQQFNFVNYPTNPMNLIDHYNTSNLKYLSKPKKQQFFSFSKAKQTQKDLPNYLIFMRYKFQQQFPYTSIVISSNKINLKSKYDEEQLALSMLHHTKYHKQFQYYNQVIINQKCQSIITKGSLLLNNQLVKINSQHKIIMALRKINNINLLISPLRVNVNPINGSIELMNCSYVDSKFTLLNHSQKNIQYFTQRISFIIHMILDQMTLLFYILQEPSFIDLYCGRFKEQIIQGQKILNCLQGSLYRTSIDFPNNSQIKLDYNSKRQKMNKCLQSFNDEMTNIIKVYNKNIEGIQNKKNEEISQLASYDYNEPQFVMMFSTNIEKMLKFSIYSKIQFSNKKIEWEYLNCGGFAEVDCATARFELIQDQIYDFPSNKKKLQTQQERTYHSKEQMLNYIQAKIIRKKQKPNTNTTPRIQRQKTIMRRLRGKKHPNILTYFQSQTSFDRQYIYALYQQNNSLESLLTKCTYMSFYQKILMIQQAAKGLLFLHKNRIIHLDFKLANLIVGKKYLVKICDFGQSYFNSNSIQSLKNHKFGNSFPYSANQAYSSVKQISEKNDIYSFGVVVYKCLFGEHIWGADINKNEFVSQLKNKGVIPKLIPEKYQQYSCQRIVKIIVFLCLRCIRREPQTRPSLFWIITVLEQIRKYLESMYK